MSGVSVGVLLNWSVHTAGISALKGTSDFIRHGREWANEGKVAANEITKGCHSESRPMKIEFSF